MHVFYICIRYIICVTSVRCITGIICVACVRCITGIMCVITLRVLYICNMYDVFCNVCAIKLDRIYNTANYSIISRCY